MIQLMQGDCVASMRELADKSVNCCITSPPYYGLRDYKVDGQAGLEDTPEEYIANMVKVFAEVKRVLRDDGTLWLNIGDSYAGYHGNKNATYEDAPSNKGGYFENQRKTLVNHGTVKNKDLIGIPWMLAFALRADGWYLRQEIIWSKNNPMPESVKDRCTKAHESIFLLSKKPKYYFDAKAIEEPAQNWGTRDRSEMRGGTTDPKLKHHGLAGKEFEENPTRNKRSVWTVNTKPYKGAHFATFPPDLIEPCVLAGCPEGGTIIDPFGGSGTVAGVAVKHNRKAIICELNLDYHNLIPARVKSISGYDMPKAVSFEDLI